MARSQPAGGTDAVRRSLDHREVDAESEDRPYLVAMLRRLGYTDGQIQDYLAGRAEPGLPAAQQEGEVQAAPAAEHAHLAHASPEHAHTEPDHGEQRDVEVEYTGPGLQDYRLVDPVDFFADDGNLVEFQADEGVAWEDADAGHETYTQGELGSDGQPLAEFTSPTDSEPAWEEPAAAPALEAAEPAWEAPAQDQAITYGDYTLYQKDDVRDGQPARVYAFSKTPPGEGYEASKELPEGYQIAENPETGRPFLRRVGEEDWGLAEAGGGSAAGGPQGGDPTRRRVRLKRVRAANREEAMRVVEREGGNPLASVPIDIEKHLGDA
ncbi:MAG: hypothetical protein QOI63_1145 [Thermoplasmata archaeon]|jgi:hypothetical protein|nr:hypothetical protein [Thermoplasmata archaeon]